MNWLAFHHADLQFTRARLLYFQDPLLTILSFWPRTSAQSYSRDHPSYAPSNANSNQHHSIGPQVTPVINHISESLLAPRNIRTQRVYSFAPVSVTVTPCFTLARVCVSFPYEMRDFESLHPTCSTYARGSMYRCLNSNGVALRVFASPLYKQ